jgi:hypothetical protein
MQPNIWIWRIDGGAFVDSGGKAMIACKGKSPARATVRVGAPGAQQGRFVAIGDGRCHSASLIDKSTAFTSLVSVPSEM